VNTKKEILLKQFSNRFISLHKSPFTPSYINYLVEIFIDISSEVSYTFADLHTVFQNKKEGAT